MKPEENFKEIVDFIESTGNPALVTIDPADADKLQIMVHKNGMTAVNYQPFIEALLPKPRQLKGRAVFTDLDSFVAHFGVFADPSSAIFADRTSNKERPFVKAIYDYNQGFNEPRYCQHTTIYAPILSNDWIRWTNQSNGLMNQKAFAEFLEDNIAVLLPPPVDNGAQTTPDDQAMLEMGRRLGGTFAGASKIIEVSRGLQVHANHVVQNAVNTSTGEISVAWATDHKGTNTSSGATTVPNLFLIGISVFEFGEVYRVPVRLRYRLSEGQIHWIISLYRPEQTFRHAFDEAVKKIALATGYTPYFGTPEVV